MFNLEEITYNPNDKKYYSYFNRRLPDKSPQFIELSFNVRRLSNVNCTLDNNDTETYIQGPSRDIVKETAEKINSSL